MKLSILGKEVRVIIEDNLSGKTGNSGMYCDENNVILLDNNLGKDKTQVLLHEVFHAVIMRSGAYNIIDRQAEEMLVDLLATTMVDNFKVIKK
jgi:Zn-dependent peptidase ImmA (M78 family)